MRITLPWISGAVVTLLTCLAQAQVTLPASATFSTSSKLVAGNTSVSVPIMIDAVSNATIEVVLGQACAETLTSPGGVINDLSASSGVFTAGYYQKYTDPDSGASRLMVSLVSPQGGQWTFRFSVAAALASDVPVVVTCQFSNGPQVLTNIPRNIVSGTPASASLVIVDTGQPIQANVSADVIMLGGQNLSPQTLPVTFDGIQYNINCSSITSTGDYLLRYSIGGSGSTGIYSRSGAQLIKFTPPAASFTGTFTTTYELSYGDH